LAKNISLILKNQVSVDEKSSSSTKTKNMFSQTMTMAIVYGFVVS